MSPRARRDLTAFAVVLSVGAVLLFLLVGGLASIGRSSGPFHVSFNGSFAAEAALVVQRTNSLGGELDSLVAAMPGLDRSQLSLGLDELASGSQAVATTAEQLASPSAAEVANDFVQAMSERAQAMRQLRRVVDGLLAITPGASSASGSAQSPFPPPAVSVTGATQELGSVGRRLLSADEAYRQARATLAHEPGRSTLPPSSWVPNPAVWDGGAVETLVDQLSSAPNLAPQPDVRLLAVSLSPPLLPPLPAVQGQPQAPPIAPGAVPIPPTCTVRVTAVVANQGTVVATKVPVQASVQSTSGGPAFVVSKELTLGPSSSAALTLPDMAVQPSNTYTLTVGLTPPTGQVGPVGAQEATIAVASFGSVKANSVCARTPAAAP